MSNQEDINFFRNDAKQGKVEKLRACGIRFTCIGIILMIIFVMIVCSEISDRRKYLEFMKKAVSVNATCVDIWSEKVAHQSRSGHHNRTTYVTEYYANIEYEYNGKTYHQSKVSVSSQENNGSVITIYISPDHPEDYMQRVEKVNYIVGMTIGASLFGIAIIIMFVLAHLSFKYEKEAIKIRNMSLKM